MSWEIKIAGSAERKGKEDEMSEILKTYEDPRPIKRIIWPGDNEPSATTGENGIEKIIPYHENGEMAPIVWLAIYCNGEITQRVNSKHLDSILYS